MLLVPSLPYHPQKNRALDLGEEAGKRKTQTCCGPVCAGQSTCVCAGYPQVCVCVSPLLPVSRRAVSMCLLHSHLLSTCPPASLSTTLLHISSRFLQSLSSLKPQGPIIDPKCLSLAPLQRLLRLFPPSSPSSSSLWAVLLPRLSCSPWRREMCVRALACLLTGGRGVWPIPTALAASRSGPS